MEADVTEEDVAQALEEFVATGALQKIRDKRTGEVSYLTGGLSIPDGCEAWKPS
jgi:hypothetical protein